MATKKNPLEAFEDAKVKEAVDRSQKQMQLWQTWKDNGHQPEHLEPLLNMYSSFIDRKAAEFGGGLAMVNPVALKADLTGHVITAFHSYDPDKGAALATHVYKRVQKSKRFVNKSQNFAYISEGKTGIIGDLQRAQSRLGEDFGRSPTPQELADHMGLPVKRVVSVQKSLIKDVPGSAIEADSGLPRLGQRQAEVLSLLPQVLTPDEHSVFELAYHPTNPLTDTKDIAKKLGLPDWEVSRRKSRILAKLNEFT
jgi:DNA-directed RNA polymerase specialized sigma subunit